MAAKKAPKKKAPKKKEKITIELKKSVEINAPWEPSPLAAPNGTHPFARRMDAMAAYLSDMNSCTVDDLHDRFKDIPVRTLRRWASEDGWIAKRKEAYASLQKRLVGETSKALTDQLYHEVKELQKWNDFSSKLLEDVSKTPPKSWEGVMKIKLEMLSRLHSISKDALLGILDEVGRPIVQQNEAAAIGPKVELSEQQLKDLAKAYTQNARDKHRAKLRETNPEMFEDEAPAPPEAPKDELPAALEDLIPEIQKPKK